MATTTKIQFGDYLNVTDEGGGTIRVDGCPPGGTSGIQFDTNPQSGDWLYWNTTSAGPNGYGLHIQDASIYGMLIEYIGDASGNGNGIIIEADEGTLNLAADDGNFIATAGGSGHSWFGGTIGDGDVIIESQASSGTGITIRNRNDGDTLLTNLGSGDIHLLLEGAGTGKMVFDLSTASNLTINGLPTSSPGGSGRVWNNLGILSIT